ncbi:MAG: phosphopantetheine-binding protein, partial [Blastocatellia bacterium]
WGEILGMERVGINENFFKLGGHSLLGTVMISRIRTAFQVELALNSLFKYPTVATLNEAIESLLIGQTDANEMAGLIESVELLSEEEINARILDERMQLE